MSHKEKNVTILAPRLSAPAVQHASMLAAMLASMLEQYKLETTSYLVSVATCISVSHIEWPNERQLQFRQ